MPHSARDEQAAWIAAQRTFAEEDQARRGEEKKVEHGDRESQLELFEFFARGRKERWMFDTAYKRIWRRLFAGPGIVRLNHETFPRRAAQLGLAPHAELYVPRLFLGRFFDMEYTLHDLTLFTLNAAWGGEAMRQIFMMFGPAGVAKSQLVEFMRAELAGTPVFHLKECPLRESPLLVIPMHLRARYADELGVRIPLDKDLCGTCRYHLEHTYSFQWQNFPVARTTISKRQNRGSASIAPYDPLTQGSEVLMGEVNFFLPGNLPIHERWNLQVGGFAQAMGGILELREASKAAREMWHLLLIATQEQQYPAPKYQEWFSSDFMIIAHANIPEVVRDRANDENDARFDRIYFPITRYSLSYSHEERIHRSMLSRGSIAQEKSGFEDSYSDEDQVRRSLVPNSAQLIDNAYSIKLHTAVGTRRYGAQFNVASRIDLPPKEGAKQRADWENMRQLFDILEILEGRRGPQALRDYKAQYPTAGLHGLSTRFMVKALGDAQAEAMLRCNMPVDSKDSRVPLERRHACWNIDDVRRRLRVHLEGELVLAHEGNARKDIERFSRLLGWLDGEFSGIFLQELKRKLYRDLRDSGVFSTILGSEEFNARREGLEKLIRILETLDERSQRPGEPDVTSGLDMGYVNRISQLMGVQSFTIPLVRKELLNAWEEFNAQGRNLETLKPPEILGRAMEAVEEYIYQTRREEFFQRVVEYIERHQGDAKAPSSLLDRLDHYCLSCLLWALKRSSSPLITL